MKSTAVKNLPTMEICKLYEMGWSVKQIADNYDCTTNSITKHLAKGGYKWDAYQAKWVKENQQAAKQSVAVKKNRQADVVTWLLKGEYGVNIITTDIVAEKFGCTCDQASGYLTSISNKGLLGMRRIGRKTYQFNPVIIEQAVVTPRNKFEQVAFTPEPKHSIPYVKPDNNDGLEHIQTILDLADKVGGLNKLIEMAEWLNKRP